MVKRKELKMEIDHEFALYLMMTLVRDSQGETVAAQRIFGQLMDLMITHIEECDDQLCICDQMENFYELLRLKYVHKTDVFPLLSKQRKKYRKILDDEGLIGTISNITELTSRSNSMYSTENSLKTQERELLDDNESTTDSKRLSKK